MPKGRTYKKRTSRRRRTARGGWRLWGRSAQVAPMPAAPSLRPRRSLMNYLMRRPPRPINFSRLSNEEFDAITDAQLDTMSERDLEGYTANLQRRSNQTQREIEKQLKSVNKVSNRLGEPFGPQLTPEEEAEIDELFTRARR